MRFFCILAFFSRLDFKLEGEDGNVIFLQANDYTPLYQGQQTIAQSQNILKKILLTIFMNKVLLEKS